MGITTLGQRLRDAMSRRQLSPAKLAVVAQSTEATISNWLNDNVRADHVKAVQLFKIADAAGISPRDLLLGEAGSRIAEPETPYPSHPVKSEHLTIALQLVSEVLEAADRALPPAKHAEAVQLAYDLLDEGLPQAKVLRFVRTAVAA